MIVKHLLPLFDQYAPDTAVALHAQLPALASNPTVNNDRFSTPDTKPKPSARDVLEKMQDELDHAKTSRERDEIFAAASVKLAIKGDVRPAI